jgi:phenylalanyl-tRNA synthetase beta chain
MKVSYNWLSQYFNEKLPTPEKLAELFTFRFSEVEGIEKVGDDTILDVKVLPDRAHYALCHRGVALEVSAITGLQKMSPKITAPSVSKTTRSIKVESKLCRRYTARVIEGITVEPSPQWLKDRLEAIGQRSINTIVDATNYVMFDTGQPLHAFDADKVNGSIVVRLAKEGEKLVTLDNKEIILDSTTLLIADEIGPLAIAGVKGGKRAEVDENTKNIILESANFDPVYVRKTSMKIGVRTESSKRFENEITPEWASLGNDECSSLIASLCPVAKVGEFVDVYPTKVIVKTIYLDPTSISLLLGESISEEVIIKILTSINIKSEREGNNLLLTIPPERLDLVSREDIVEEVGRLYGYENLKLVLPSEIRDKPKAPKNFYYHSVIRDILSKKGFSEIFTSSFQSTGEIEIEKSLASDKNFLRKNLIENMKDALVRNTYNADLIGITDVKIFEIGKIFGNEGESFALSLGVKKIKKEKGITDEGIIKNVIEILRVVEIAGDVEIIKGEFGYICHMDIDAIISKLKELGSEDKIDYKSVNTRYQKISQYPFISRDIAIFLPEDANPAVIEDVIKENATDLCLHYRLFDVFTKTFQDGTKKTSYAYRLVFQSYEKTLTEGDVNPIMESITEKLKRILGAEVR